MHATRMRFGRILRLTVLGLVCLIGLSARSGSAAPPGYYDATAPIVDLIDVGAVLPRLQTFNETDLDDRRASAGHGDRRQPHRTG